MAISSAATVRDFSTKNIIKTYMRTCLNIMSLTSMRHARSFRRMPSGPLSKCFQPPHKPSSRSSRRLRSSRVTTTTTSLGSTPSREIIRRGGCRCCGCRGRHRRASSPEGEVVTRAVAVVIVIVVTISCVGSTRDRCCVCTWR